MILAPGFIVAVDDVLPSGLIQSLDFRGAGFNAMPVLRRIGANHLHINGVAAGLGGGIVPAGPGQPDGINRISDHRPAKVQIIHRHRIADQVAGLLGGLGSHLLLVAVGTKFRKMRSSMLRAIESGRPPGVELLNGEVVTRGRKHGIATPYNAAIVSTVEAQSRGETAHGLDAVRAIRTLRIPHAPSSPAR